MISALTLGYGPTRCVARLLGCSPRKVRRMVALGELERVPSDLGVPLYRLWPVVKLAVLRALPGTADQVAERTGVPVASVRRALTSLSEAEQATSANDRGPAGRPNRVWAPTPRGAGVLRQFGLARIVEDVSGGREAQNG